MKHIFFKIRMVTFLLTILTGCLLATWSVYGDDELYFNDSGDLVFSTYDKSATSGTRYKTIGWVIKRYEDTIIAPGQYSVNLARSGYLYQTEDPANPGYIYSTFIIDGSYILGRVRTVSTEWESQLKKYGGYIYIDSIMTVSEQGADQGSISTDGVMQGECYNTYEGIRSARGWADGDKLRGYYNLRVKYPYLVTELPKRIVRTEVKNLTEKMGGTGNFTVGSYKAGQEKFDVSQGIPSGEELYVKGEAERDYCVINYQDVKGSVYVPVKIVTDYTLRWTDTVGNFRSEPCQIIRWYYAKKDFRYKGIKSYQNYSLRSATGNSECFDRTQLGAYTASVQTSHSAFQDKDRFSCPAYVTEYRSKTVWSGNNQKPSIPDENIQSIADQKEIVLKVRSDQLIVDGRLVLSGEWCQNTGKDLKQVVFPKQAVYKEQVKIPREKQNKAGYHSDVTMAYVLGTETITKKVTTVNTVTVHTPVGVGVSFQGSIGENECLVPSNTDWVIGTSAYLSLGREVAHREIPGYGVQNYLKYAKNVEVRFPFRVQYKDVVYPGNTWISILYSGNGIFYLPQNIKEGEYEMECRVLAYNAPGNINDTDMEEGANLDLLHHGAVARFPVRVVGKIYGLTLEHDGWFYEVGPAAQYPEEMDSLADYLPMATQMRLETSNEYRIGVYGDQIGDEEGESLEGILSYSVQERINGKYVRTPVDIYEAEDENFSGTELKKMSERLTAGAGDAGCISPGIYFYKWDIIMPDKMIIVPKGTDVSGLTMESEKIIKNPVLFVHLDLYSCRNGERFLSYLNETNAKQGYCNRWAHEGYERKKYVHMDLEYGDLLIFNMKNMISAGGIVVGTH